jgi:hypothetical protein
MTSTDSTPSAPGRGWATASAVLGAVWLAFSLTPLFATTVLGLPFAAAAFAAGWWSRRRGQAAGDPATVRRANWGLGLGCAGCLWQVVYYSLVVIVGASLLSAGAAPLFRFFQGTPAP